MDVGVDYSGCRLTLATRIQIPITACFYQLQHYEYPKRRRDTLVRQAIKVLQKILQKWRKYSAHGPYYLQRTRIHIWRQCVDNLCCGESNVFYLQEPDTANPEPHLPGPPGSETPGPPGSETRARERQRPAGRAGGIQNMKLTRRS